MVNVVNGKSWINSDKVIKNLQLNLCLIGTSHLSKPFELYILCRKQNKSNEDSYSVLKSLAYIFLYFILHILNVFFGNKSELFLQM